MRSIGGLGKIVEEERLVDGWNTGQVQDTGSCGLVWIQEVLHKEAIGWEPIGGSWNTTCRRIGMG
jgi:hypothetical protein